MQCLFMINAARFMLKHGHAAALPALMLCFLRIALKPSLMTLDCYSHQFNLSVGGVQWLLLTRTLFVTLCLYVLLIV